jgi:hypothetical protein
VEIQRCVTRDVWDLQLRQPGLALKQGTTYEVSFRIRADASRRMAVGVNTHKYSSLGLFEEIMVEPVWREMIYRFVPTSTDVASELHFDVGGSTIAVELAGMMVRRVPDGVVVKPGAPLVE